MASFLLGDEYASSSSSSEEETSPRAHPDTKELAPVAAATSTQLLPSADELFASDTSSVLTTNRSTISGPSHKRKSEQTSRPATKAVKTESGEAARKPKIAPFAPPQLRRPNISTEDRSSWNTDKTLALQRKAKEADAHDK
ncbi:hypothetical protein PR003_g7862 [Phytophthora rubi]|uniref:Uncharacterized protein n=1 Tax=Phytophthora rubi TaxID=129364 RepID=A0A6A3MQX8_9STRA|nr:hypothetical protein PR002_g7601 [Phytophthora rubi]KAE9039891.1 hypothetical protein PR001_g7322 [Phytophthora rubi]KAE9345615.1 hypothetical protein PR003_g7862 [Phytophthora rubi]